MNLSVVADIRMGRLLPFEVLTRKKPNKHDHLKPNPIFGASSAGFQAGSTLTYWTSNHFFGPFNYHKVAGWLGGWVAGLVALSLGPILDVSEPMDTHKIAQFKGGRHDETHAQRNKFGVANSNAI